MKNLKNSWRNLPRVASEIANKTKLHYTVAPPNRPYLVPYQGPNKNVNLKKYMDNSGGSKYVKPQGTGNNLSRSKKKTPEQKAKKLHKLGDYLAKKVFEKLTDNLTGNDHGVTISVGTEKRDVMPNASAHSKRRFEMVNSTEPRFIHKTEFITGYRPTKGVYDAARQNGTAYAGLWDTKMDMTETIARNSLTSGAGFNSKSMHIPSSNMQLSNKWVERVVLQGIGADDSALTLQNNQTDRRKIYAAVINMKNQFMIHNTSSFFPMHFKICLGIYNSKQSPGETFITTAQSSALTVAEYNAVDAAIEANSTSLPENFGKVPWQYQHDGYQISGSGSFDTFFDCAFSLKGRGIAESSQWKDQVTLVESFEKTIPPGDFWNFSHVHYFGGGIDLTRFTEMLTSIDGRNRRTDPHTYLIWFETKGTMCEGVYKNEASTDTYLGTSPTYFSYENKLSCYYVKDKDVAPSTTATTTSSRVYRREYFSDPIKTGIVTSNNRKEFFVTNGNVVDNIDTTDVGVMYIPMMTGASLNATTNTAGNAG